MARLSDWLIHWLLSTCELGDTWTRCLQQLHECLLAWFASGDRAGRVGKVLLPVEPPGDGGVGSGGQSLQVEPPDSG